jgi:hypothetical protein
MIGALSISAAGQTLRSARVTGRAVALAPVGALSIGFTPPSVQSITFDFTDSAQAVARGQKVMKAAQTPPTWTLEFHPEGSQNIQVCAYVSSDLIGSGPGESIPGAWLQGTPIGGSSTAFTGNGCGLPNNAVTLDVINGAAGDITKSEGFTALSLQLPGGIVPAPGTYYGTLTIVAQLQ